MSVGGKGREIPDLVCVKETSVSKPSDDASKIEEVVKTRGEQFSWEESVRRLITGQAATLAAGPFLRRTPHARNKPPVMNCTGGPLRPKRAVCSLTGGAVRALWTLARTGQRGGTAEKNRLMIKTMNTAICKNETPRDRVLYQQRACRRGKSSARAQAANVDGLPQCGAPRRHIERAAETKPCAS